MQIICKTIENKEYVFEYINRYRLAYTVSQ